MNQERILTFPVGRAYGSLAFVSAPGLADLFERRPAQAPVAIERPEASHLKVLVGGQGAEELEGEAVFVEDLDLEELLAQLRREGARVDEFHRRRALGEFDVAEDEDRYEPHVEPDGEEDSMERLRVLGLALEAQMLEQGYVPYEGLPGDSEHLSEHQLLGIELVSRQPEYVRAQIEEALFASYQEAYDDPYWRDFTGIKPIRSHHELTGKFRLRSVLLPQEGDRGSAIVVFRAESTWEDDQGLFVVIRSGQRPECMDSDDLSYLFQPEEDEQEPSPYDELVEALLDGDLKRADRLVEMGADINAVPFNEDPPLHSAVDQEDPVFLERLLRYGADPTLRDPAQRLTPLMLVRRMRKDLMFSLEASENLSRAGFTELFGIGESAVGLDAEARKLLQAYDQMESLLLKARTGA